MLHFPELHHFPVTFGDGQSKAAFTRLEVRGRPKGPRRTGTPARRSRGWGEKENDKGSGHLGRSDGAASKSSILPSAVGEADLEAQRASNLAAYMPPLRISKAALCAAGGSQTLFANRNPGPA